MIKAENLAIHKGIQHAFFSRRGGVSEGIYESLNCGYGSGDDPQKVLANCETAMSKIQSSAKDLLTVHQIHSAKAVPVTMAWSRKDRPKADAMVTDRRGIALGILTADCAPVLFADPVSGVVGAAHAGWRGSVGGILEATIAAMEKLGAKRKSISVALGPCIRQASYEVGREFKEYFIELKDSHESFFKPAEREHHAMFDLAGFIIDRLRSLDVECIEDTGIDTYPQGEGFFSFRRSTHRGERDYGRELSVIMLGED